jgi:hypothetical protein
VDGITLKKPFHWGGAPIAFGLTNGTHTILLEAMSVRSFSQPKGQGKVTLNALPGKSYVVRGQQNGSEYIMWIEDATTHEICSDHVITSGMGLPAANQGSGGAMAILGAISQGANIASSANGFSSALSHGASSAHVMQQAANVSTAISGNNPVAQSLQQSADIANSMNGLGGAMKSGAPTAQILQQTANITGTFNSLQQQNQAQLEQQQTIDNARQQREQREQQRRVAEYQAAHPPLPKGAYQFDDAQLGNVTIVTCNFSQNFEEDNTTHFPEDFVGIKNYFSTKEKISIYFVTNVKQVGYGYKIWNGDGDLVSNYTSPTNTACIQYTSTPNATNALASSSYTAVFYHENTLIKKFSFVVGN